MSTMPKSLFWSRTDVPGADHALAADGRGLTARGTALAVDPIPFTCRYQLRTDERWAAEGLEVSCEGAGWLRTVRLERAAGRWRATTAEQGDLDAALAAAGQPAAGLPGTEEPERLADAVDVDLSASPLFNTLPVRRLGLRDATPGSSHRIVVVWVLVPSLQVVPAEQTYTVLEGGNVRFSSGSFTADLALDADGYVLHYPGLAHRH
ncbi:putative glycolipid-binding domain-containing protein [Plantactinospora veratri]|uniref:Glycolipid-binding domain-containing protein n=1 Tax=Plantactinospora veratri TaxID=1436122 RepID=A0ABU7S5U4_9ACTN